MSPHEDVIILIAEAHPEIQSSLANLFSGRYRIVTAQDCVTLMTRAQTRPLPDLILLDFNINIFDAYKACAYLRSNTDIPVISVMRNQEKETDNENINSGRFDCTTIFPGNEEELIGYVDELLVDAVKNRQDLSVLFGNQYQLDNISRSLIDYSVDALIISDLHGRTVEFNRAAEILFGFSRQFCIGRNINEFLIPPEYQLAHARGMEALRNKKGLTPKYLKRVNASALCSGDVRLDIELSLYLVEMNRSIYCVASIRDRTAIQQMANALKDTLLVAEQSVTNKDIEIERVKKTERNTMIALQTQQVVNHILHLSLENCSLQEKLQIALDFISRLPWLTHGDNWFGIYLKNRKENIFDLVVGSPVDRFPERYHCPYASNECSSCLISLHVNPLLSLFGSHDDRFLKEELEGRIDYCIPLLSGNENIGIARIIAPQDFTHGVFDNLLLDSIGKVLVNLIIRSRLDQALLESKKETEKASTAKSEFLANMSHEIRSPLNAIIGMTDLVLSTPLSREEMFGNLEIVRSSSLSLLDLINGILDLSKIEAGHFVLERIPFDLLGQLEGVCEMLAIKAHQKGLSLYNRLPPDLPHSLEGDPVRLKQILINLINNAIKFTSSGEIVLAIEHARVREESCNQELWLRFSVTDTGIGIPEEQQQKIFQNFVQADGSIARKYGGTGLGLTISRHLVEMMGGSLQVESREGQGSCFHFTIPFSVVHQVERLEAWMTPRSRNQEDTVTMLLAGKRILLADVHPTGTAIVCNLLCHHGAVVTCVDNRHAFLEQMEQKATELFDLLLVDETIVQGCDCLAREPYLYYQSRIIVMVSTHQTSRNFILDGVLQKVVIIKKPVRQFHLLKKILKILSPHQDQSAGDDTQPPTLPKTKRPFDVLLVDDLPANQKLAQDILTLQGHRVTIANNGVEALATLKGGARFDLILMDLQMPIMDGFETARRIRNGDPSEIGNPQVPIVAVSAMVMMNEKMKCYDIGMNGFLLKPYQTHELINVVSSFTKIQEPQVRKPLAEIVLSTVDTDIQTLNHFKKVFAVEVQDHLRQLEHSLMHSDLSSVIREGDWLRTMAGHIGASRLASHAIRLTGQAEMESWEDALTMYLNLEQYVEALVQRLTEESVA